MKCTISIQGHTMLNDATAKALDELLRTPPLSIDGIAGRTPRVSDANYLCRSVWALEMVEKLEELAFVTQTKSCFSANRQGVMFNCTFPRPRDDCMYEENEMLLPFQLRVVLFGDEVRVFLGPIKARTLATAKVNATLKDISICVNRWIFLMLKNRDAWRKHTVRACDCSILEEYLEEL